MNEFRRVQQTVVLAMAIVMSGFVSPAFGIDIEIEIIEKGEVVVPPGFAPDGTDPNVKGPSQPDPITRPSKGKEAPPAAKIEGTGTLQGLADAAAKWWETAFPKKASATEDFKIKVRVGWSDQLGNNAGFHFLVEQKKVGAEWRETKGVVLLNNNPPAIVGKYFLDNTPHDSSEWQNSSTVVKQLPGRPEKFTISERAINPKKKYANTFDLLTTLKHEIGHSLGLSFQREGWVVENIDKKIDVERGGANGLDLPTDNGDHLSEKDMPHSLMSQGGGKNEGVPKTARRTRTLQSEVDILAMAELSDWDSDSEIVRNVNHDLPPPVTQGKKTSSAATSRSEPSMHFDAGTQLLTIDQDFITATAFPGDPLVGSQVLLPEFEFAGFSPDLSEAIFYTDDENRVMIRNGGDTFLVSQIDALNYHIERNVFFGVLFDLTLGGVAGSSPFFDPALASPLSPWINDIHNVLDPASPSHKQGSTLFFTFEPDTNFWNLTNVLAQSGSSGGNNEIYTQEVPAPPVLALVFIGLPSMVMVARRYPKGRARRYARLDSRGQT